MDPASLYNNIENIMAGIDLSEALSHPVTGFPVIFLKGSHSDYLSTSEMDADKKSIPNGRADRNKGCRSLDPCR